MILPNIHVDNMNIYIKLKAFIPVLGVFIFSFGYMAAEIPKDMSQAKKAAKAINVTCFRS